MKIFVCGFLLILTSLRVFSQTCTLTVSAVASTNSICAGGSVTIDAQTSGGNAPLVYSWSTGETTRSIAVTTAGTYTVSVTDNTAACGTIKASVTISNPGFLKVADTYICEGNSAFLSASGADTYQWQDASGNTLSNQGNFVTPVLNNSTTYYVIGTKNGCQTAPIAVTANVVPYPAAPNAASVSICAGSAVTLTASSNESTVFDWFTTPTGGRSLITSPDYTTPVLTSTTTYYVQASNGSCPGPRTAVTVTVNPIPGVPQTADQTVCSNSAATLTASATGGTIKWYDSSFGNIPLATGPTFQTPVLTASTTFYVQNMNDQSGCSSERVPVIVTVMPQVPHPIAAGTTVCTGSTATLTASSTQTGTTFQWFDAATGGNQVATGATFTSPPLSATVTYYVQGIYQGCVGPRTDVTVNVITMPVAPTVTGTSSICAGTSAIVTASGGTASYKWYDAAIGGNLLYTGQTFTTPAVTANTTFYVEATNGNCSSNRVAFVVSTRPAPAAPIVTSPSGAICPGATATLTASASGTITWFDAASGGNAVGSGPSFTTPALGVTFTYYAENSNGDCPSPRTPGTVTVTSSLSPVFGYFSGTFCLQSGGVQNPIINPAISGPYHFTSQVGLLLNPNTGAITVTGSLPGDYTVTMTTGSNPCIIATQSVTISAGAGSAAFSYTSNSFCQYDTNPVPTFNTGAYPGRFTAGSGLVFVDNTTGQIDLARSSPGTYAVTNRLLCSGTTATVNITILPRTAVDAGPDVDLIIGTAYQITGSAKVGSATIRWSTNGTGTFSDPTSLHPIYTPGQNELSPVTLILTAADEGNGCSPLSDQMVITYSQPVVTVSAAAICPGGSATLTASGSSSGIYEWFTTPTGGSPIFTGNPFIISPSITTTYYVGTRISGTPSERTPVTVTVTPAANLTVTGNIVCFDTQATLIATADIPGGSYEWYDANNILLTTGASYKTPFLQQNTRYFLRYVTTGCSTALIPVDVTVNPIPQITSPLTLQACSGAAINYPIQSTVAASYTWARAAVSGISNPAAAGQTASITETLINTTTNPINVIYDVSALSNTCSSPPFKLVVTVNPTLIFTSAASEEICNQTSSDYEVKLNFTPTSISWARAAVPGIRNAAITGQTSPVIHEILYNDTSSPITVQYVYTALSLGCAASTFNVAVTVDPTATVTSASTIVVCSGTALNYKMTANVNTATFSWTRAATSGISNAAAAANQATAITETLINTTSSPVIVNYFITPYFGVCKGIPITLAVTVNPTPATPLITAPDEICTGTTLNLGTTNVDGATYAWTGPDNFISASQNPAIANATTANAGTYTLTVTVNGCVSSTATKIVTVDGQPTTLAGADQIVCAGYPIQLKGTVTGRDGTGIWSTNGAGTFLPSNTDLNARYIPSTADAGLVSLTFTLTSTALVNCSIASSTFTATLIPPATADAGPDQNICNQNTSVTLSGKATNATTFAWSTTGTGVFSTPSNQLSTTYVMSGDDLKKGSIIFTLATSNGRCDATNQKTVRFLPPPVISAGQKLNYILRNAIFKLNPTVNQQNVRYLWSPNTYLDNDTLKNASLTGVIDQVLTLKVTDTLGCVSTDQLSFIVLDPIVTYNTFTPNGDGVNDLWNIPALIKYPGAVVDIYNRYGVLMYHSNGYSIPWDGTYNGQLAPTGVYYYVIATQFSSQKVSGYVALIR